MCKNKNARQGFSVNTVQSRTNEGFSYYNKQIIKITNSKGLAFPPDPQTRPSRKTLKLDPNEEP